MNVARRRITLCHRWPRGAGPGQRVCYRVAQSRKSSGDLSYQRLPPFRCRLGHLDGHPVTSSALRRVGRASCFRAGTDRPLTPRLRDQRHDPIFTSKRPASTSCFKLSLAERLWGWGWRTRIRGHGAKRAITRPSSTAKPVPCTRACSSAYSGAYSGAYPGASTRACT